MACCKPFAGSPHHPFCVNNAYVGFPSMQLPSFEYTAAATTYRIYASDDAVIVEWVLKNLGHIMAINGRPLAVMLQHVLDSIATSSNFVTSHMNNTLTGFAILEPKSIPMRNKFRELRGDVVKSDKNTVVFVGAIVVSVIYTVPGHGCDLMGFLRATTPLKRVLALEAVKGSEKFYKRIGMVKYGEDTKYKHELFVSGRYDFFLKEPAVQFKQRPQAPLVDFFPPGFGDHVLSLTGLSLDDLRTVTGCPVPPVPVEHKSISIFYVPNSCKTCGNELCLCDEDEYDMDLPGGGMEQQLPPEAGGFSFAAAEAYGAKLKNEAEEAAAAAKTFGALVEGVETARKSAEAAEAAAVASKEQAKVLRQAAEASRQAAAADAEAARKSEELEAQLCVAHAAAMVTSAAALKSLEAAVSSSRKKRARSP